MASRCELLTPPREQLLSPTKPMRPSPESLLRNCSDHRRNGHVGRIATGRSPPSADRRFEYETYGLSTSALAPGAGAYFFPGAMIRRRSHASAPDPPEISSILEAPPSGLMSYLTTCLTAPLKNVAATTLSLSAVGRSWKARPSRVPELQ